MNENQIQFCLFVQQVLIIQPVLLIPMFLCVFVSGYNTTAVYQSEENLHSFSLPSSSELLDKTPRDEETYSEDSLDDTGKRAEDTMDQNTSQSNGSSATHGRQVVVEMDTDNLRVVAHETGDSDTNMEELKRYLEKQNQMDDEQSGQTDSDSIDEEHLSEDSLEATSHKSDKLIKSTPHLKLDSSLNDLNGTDRFTQSMPGPGLPASSHFDYPEQLLEQRWNPHLDSAEDVSERSCSSDLEPGREQTSQTLEQQRDRLSPEGSQNKIACQSAESGDESQQAELSHGATTSPHMNETFKPAATNFGFDAPAPDSCGTVSQNVTETPREDTNRPSRSSHSEGLLVNSAAANSQNNVDVSTLGVDGTEDGFYVGVTTAGDVDGSVSNAALRGQSLHTGDQRDETVAATDPLRIHTEDTSLDHLRPAFEDGIPSERASETRPDLSPQSCVNSQSHLADAEPDALTVSAAGPLSPVVVGGALSPGGSSARSPRAARSRASPASARHRLADDDSSTSDDSTVQGIHLFTEH